MDLALHLGAPAGSLAKTMTEAEFGDWQTYAARRMMPWRRVEMYLAQIAMLIAKTMGGHKGGLDDFLFDPPEEEPEVDDVIAAQEFFGFNPIKKA